MDVTINNVRTSPPSELATWGDLLDWIETKQLKAGQCITRVCFQGQEEVNYRKSALCELDLHGVGPIHIESGEFDTVIRESFAELEAELRASLESSRQIIQLLESRSEEKAYNQLAQLLDSIRIFYSVFSEDLGWAYPPNPTIAPAALTATLENAIRQLIAAQENRFWVSICDVLEYEITPILENWLLTVERTRARIN